MDDNNEKVKYSKDAVVDDNDTTMMVDTEVENKELTKTKHMKVEDDNEHEQSPPHSEPEGAKSDENKYSSSTRDDDLNPFEIVNSHPGDSVPNHPVVKEGIDVAVETATGTTTIYEVSNNAALHGNAEKLDDGPNVDHPIQQDYDITCEGSVETKPEDEVAEELESGARMDLHMENNKTKEKELTNGVAGMQLPLEVEELNNGVVNGKDLPPKRERKEEEEVLNNGVELPPKSEAKEEAVNNGIARMKLPPSKEELNIVGHEIKEELPKTGLEIEAVGNVGEMKSSSKSFLLDPNDGGIDESGTEEEQAAFMKELETFHRERCLEFKPPRFYGEPLNCLKLWRAVIRLGGYEQVTSCKLWRQVGESFKPPKTCTTVSWTFRCFYEKALLEYEKHKMQCGELPFSDASFTGPITAGNQMQVGDNQSSGSGRARRDAAARAMQGWHSQRLLGNGEVGDPIIKDKNSTSTPKREKQLKSVGLLKRKKPSPVERAIKVARLKASKPQLDSVVVDVGPPADWVKINVQRTKDCFEVYALVPGLLREEVRVQSDPAGRLVISGQPEQVDNPWGVTHFKKVVSLPSRIDPHQTSAVVTLHGQLFVRVPFEQSDV